MLGWRAHIVYDTDKLNSALRGFHAGRPDDRPTDCETLEFEISTSSGWSWQVVKCTLGAPLLSFSTLPGDESISIARRCVDYLDFTLRRNPSSPVRYIEAITASNRTGALTLLHSFDASDCKGVYEPGKRVRLEVDKGRSSFHIGYPGRDKWEPAEGFKLRFDALPPNERYVSLHEVDRFPGSEWLLRPLRFYPRASKSASTYICYIAFNGDNDGSLAPLAIKNASGSARPEDERLTSNSDLNTYVSIYSIPAEGYRRDDFYSLSMLLHPPRHHGCTGAVQLYDVICGLFEPNSPAVAEVRTDAPQSNGVKPLVKIVSAGESFRKAVHASPVDKQPQYDLPGKGKTAQASATRASTPRPVQIKYVSTGNFTFPLYSTYVVLNRAPTHDFKLSKSGDKLKLVLWYLDKNGVEREIDPRTTQWSVLAGDGRVSADGIYTPGSLNNFSVIFAVDPDPTHWYWAVIIVPVPMLSVDDFLKLTGRG